MDKTIAERNAIEDQRQLQVCLDWLKDKPKTKNINKNVCILDIQQTIEHKVNTYVSKDVVFEAVKILGIPYQRDPVYPDTVYLALSSSILYRYIMPKEERIINGYIYNW